MAYLYSKRYTRFINNFSVLANLIERLYNNFMEMKGLNTDMNADLNLAIEYLKSENCSEIFIFGSLVAGSTHKKSDIDIAVRGLKPENFFSVYGELMMLLKHSVDLVDLDLQKEFGKTLKSSGNLHRVA